MLNFKITSIITLIFRIIHMPMKYFTLGLRCFISIAISPGYKIICSILSFLLYITIPEKKWKSYSRHKAFFFFFFLRGIIHSVSCQKFSKFIIISIKMSSPSGQHDKQCNLLKMMHVPKHKNNY